MVCLICKTRKYVDICEAMNANFGCVLRVWKSHIEADNTWKQSKHAIEVRESSTREYKNK